MFRQIGKDVADYHAYLDLAEYETCWSGGSHSWSSRAKPIRWQWTCHRESNDRLSCIIGGGECTFFHIFSTLTYGRTGGRSFTSGMKSFARCLGLCPKHGLRIGRDRIGVFIGNCDRTVIKQFINRQARLELHSATR